MQKEKENSSMKGRVRIITTEKNTGKVLRVSEWTNNLIVSGSNTGKNLIAQRLAGVNTYTLNITHADIGTGTDEPANSDTKLQSAEARSAIATVVANNNIVTFRFFFSDANLPNNSYTEFGTFVDGSSSVDTGQLFNRLLFTENYVKSSGEDSTFEVEFTIN